MRSAEAEELHAKMKRETDELVSDLTERMFAGETFETKLEIQDPFIAIDEQDKIVFCRAPRDASEERLQQRIERAIERAARCEAIDRWLKGELTLTSEEVCDRAALLCDIDFADRRKKICKKLDWPVGDFDGQIRKRRPAVASEDELQGEPLKIEEPDPYPHPVDGAQLLSAMSAFFSRFIIFERPSDPDVLALWALGTHCVDCFNIFPRLGLSSPDAECGKSSVLDILNCFVCRPLMTSNLTTASAFRVIELLHPTLLVDELDSFIESIPDIGNLLNSGHKRGSHVLRVVGEKMEVRKFATYGPVAYCTIGKPGGPLRSRSILIRMLRKLADQVTENFSIEERPALAAELLNISRKAIRWANDHDAEVKNVSPATGKLANRQRDNWRALLKVAEVSGGVWPEKVFEAAGVPPPKRKQSNEIRILRDIRNIFYSRKVRQIPSKILVADLLLQTESPWYRLHSAREPLDMADLADLLDAFDIDPKPLRLSEPEQQHFFESKQEQPVTKGYKLEQFATPFARMLQGEAPEVVPVSKARVI